MTMMTLPYLRRARLSFHFIAGTKDSEAEPTTLEILTVDQDEHRLVYTPEEYEMFNDGWVENVTHWPWIDTPLPVLPRGSHLRFESEFSKQHGVIAMDNIRLYTAQK